MPRVFLSLLLIVSPLLCTPKAQAKSLMSVEKIIPVDGINRHYRLFVPTGAKGALPVVVVLHGGGSNARQMEYYTKFNDVAQREGFIAIYPEAVSGNWNDGRGMDFIRAQRENIDDVKFIRDAIDAVAKEHKIDRSRIFATGISNGALMSHRLAAQASDLFDAIAPVSGGMCLPIAEHFDPKHPVSILIIQGDADPLVPIDSGEITVFHQNRGKVLPTSETLAKYVKRNGNHGEPSTSKLQGQPGDPTSVEITKYPDGPGGVKTYYYRIKDGGHAWPGRPPYLPESLIGKASQAFSASDAIADFFKRCPPRATAAPHD
jgi:polyhydroxybutyrate depolymerase